MAGFARDGVVCITIPWPLPWIAISMRRSRALPAVSAYPSLADPAYALRGMP